MPQLQYHHNMASWASNADELYRQYIVRPPSVEPPQPLWNTQSDMVSWLDGSLSSNSSVSPDSLSPINSPHTEFNHSLNSQCSTSSTELPIVSLQPLKKIRNVRKSDKYHCSVCGDKPTGYHYDVLSCNGCKTFFRRTIINNRTFKCTKGGNCEFTKDFRCACRACRFDKCVRVGMNKTAIQFPTKGQDYTDDGDSNDGQEGTSQAVVPVPPSNRLVDTYTAELQWVEALARREEAVHCFRRWDLPKINLSKGLKELLRDPLFLGKNVCENKPAQLYSKNPVKFWMVMDLFLVVEFAKTFDAFRMLSEDDQRILISHIGGLLHVATQAYYSYFDAKSSNLVFPDGINAMENKLVEMKINEKRMVHFHEAFLRGTQNAELQARTFRASFANYYYEMYSQPVALLCNAEFSPKEFSFFKAIALFSPNEVDMSQRGREIVAEERFRLTGLLRKYLIAEHGLNKGLDRMTTVLTSIPTYISYGERRREYLSLCNLMQFPLSELAKDVYLKHYNQ